MSKLANVTYYWSHHFLKFYGATMTWLTVMEYLCHKWPRICSTCKHFPVFFSFMTDHRVVTRLTRWVSLVEQELLILLEHLSSSPPLPVFNGVRVTRSLVFFVCFVDRCLSFCTFSFGHCVVCSSIYGLWLALWYLQTLFTWRGEHYLVLLITTCILFGSCIFQ